MAKAHVYLLPGANVEATDTFASWIDTTNQIVYDMGTVVLTTTQYSQPNTSVGGYTSGNAHVQGIFSANTLVATDGLRGGSTSAYGDLIVSSNTIFNESALVQIGANTNNFTVNANNSLFTGNVAINSSKTVLISAANTTINAGPLYVRTNTELTGGRVDIDAPILDITSNTTITAVSLFANVDNINLGVNSSDTLTVNAAADFNSSVNIDGLFTVTANATFSGDKVTINSSNTVIGDSTSDRLNVTAYLQSDLIPVDATVDLGTASNKYGNAHVTNVYAGSDVEASGEFRLKGSTAKTLRVSDTEYQDLRLVFDNGTTANTAVVANTSGLFGGVNQLYSLGSSSVNWKDLYVQNSFVTGNEVVTGDVAVNGGDITTSATTFNLLNDTATTVNAFGAGSAIVLGATTGTLTLNNPTLVGSQTTQNLYNTVATTVNAFGAATAVNIGASTGTITLNNATAALNGGTVTTNKTTFTLLNTTATTVTAFGAATTLNLGNASAAQTINLGNASTGASTYNIGTGATATATTKTINLGTGGAAGSTTNVNIGSSVAGTTTLNSATVVGAATTVNLWNTTSTTVNAFGAATAVSIGAGTGNTTINNNAVITGDVAVNGGDITSSAATFNVLNQSATVNAFTNASSVSVGGSTGTLTLNNPTVVGSATTVNLWNTTSTTVNAFGAASTLNVGAADAAITLGKTTGNTSLSIAGNGTGGTATITSNVTTGKIAIGPSLTTGSVEVGSGNTGSAKVLFTTDSSTTSTGAFVVAGGVGIAKQLRVGNNAIISGDLTVLGAVDFQGNVNVNLAEANTAVLKVTTNAIFNGTISSSLVPGANTAYNLGTSDKRWLDAFANNVTITSALNTSSATVSGTTTTAGLTVVNGNKDSIVIDTNIAGTSAYKITIRTPVTALSANRVLNLADGDTTLQAGTMAITGAGLNQFASTTSAQLAGVISDETGSGSLVFSNSPTLVTPTLGVATATSINKVTITAPATSATLTIANGKTATINNTLTFSGTDASSVAFGAGGTVVYTSNKLSALSSTTSAELAGVISDETGTGVLVFGTAPTFTTSIDSSATFGAFASSTALTLGYTGTAASTLNVSTGAVANATTKTINIGTGGAAGSTTNINFGSSSGTGTATFNNDLVVTGNLTVNGTTSTINSTTITVDDKNIELGSIASPTNVTADGGGITLKGTTDKTLNWVNATGAWTSSEDFNLLSGKVYEINGTAVLSATALGSGVVSSSLTSVGTIGTGTWQGSVINSTYGGTGVNNGGRTLTLNTGNLTVTSQAAGSSVTLGGNISTANSFSTSGNFALTLTTTGATNVTLPTSGTLAVVGSGLNQFASTTSAQLAGVISDETGSGSLVFANGPTISGASFTGNTVFDTDLLVLDAVNNRVSVGSTTNYATRVTQAGSDTATLQINDVNGGVKVNMLHWATGPNGSRLQLGKSKSGVIGTHTAVVNGDTLSEIQAVGSDGTEFIVGTEISSVVDGTPSAGYMPTAILFRSSASANTITTKAFLAANGNFGIGTTTPTSLLQVAGTSNFIGNSTFGANVAITGTVTSGTWNGSVINSTYGGTGVNNGGRTLTINTGNLTVTSQSAGSSITLGGNISTANSFSTSGNFALTLTTTGATSVTLPTTGTLATLAGSEALSNKTISGGSINNTPIGATTASTGNFSTLSIGGVAITATADKLNFANTVTSNIQTQLDAKAPLASPALTGTPTAPTATAGTNTTQIATTAFVNTSIAGKANTAGDTFTGDVAFSGKINRGGSISVASWTTSGAGFSVNQSTYTDTSSTGGSTIGARTSSNFGIPTFASTNATTLTNASTLLINGEPTAGANTTITNAHAIHVLSGRTYLAPSGSSAVPTLAIGGVNTGLYSAVTNTLSVSTGGNIAATFDASGNFAAAGNVTAYSDERLKSNVRTIDSALDKVSSMRGVYFDKDGAASTGVIAQEVQKVLPEVVHEGEYLSVAYGNMVGVLIEAIKELKAEIEELKRGK